MKGNVKISKGANPQTKDKNAAFVTGAKTTKTPKPKSLTPKAKYGKK